MLFWFFILQLVISTQNFPARTAPDAFLVKTYVIGLRIAMINLMRRMVGRNVVSLNFINYQNILLILLSGYLQALLTYNIFCSFPQTEIGQET